MKISHGACHLLENLDGQGVDLGDEEFFVLFLGLVVEFLFAGVRVLFFYLLEQVVLDFLG